MVHHWRASDQLEQSFRAGQWFMFDRGHLVGVIQLGRINRRWGFRGLTPDDVEDDRRVLGYAWTLEDAADRLWAWYQRDRSSTPAPARGATRSD